MGSSFKLSLHPRRSKASKLCQLSEAGVRPSCASRNALQLFSPLQPGSALAGSGAWTLGSADIGHTGESKAWHLRRVLPEDPGRAILLDPETKNDLDCAWIMATHAPFSPSKDKLAAPRILWSRSGAVLSHYRSELVDRIRARGNCTLRGGLTVKLAKEFGFCYGVERAIDLAYAARRSFPDPVDLYFG